MTEIRVLIADDMALHRELLGKLLERQPDISVVGEAGTPEEAVAATAALSPDVVLIDLRMPRHDPQGGIRAIRQIGDRYPNVKVLALTESDDEADVRAVAPAAAIGYVVKSVKAAKIAEAVRAAYAGKGCGFRPQPSTSMMASRLSKARPSGRFIVLLAGCPSTFMTPTPI